MAESPASITIPGTGVLHVAVAGSALPTDIDEALDAAFFDVGIIHEDGATFTDGKSAGTDPYGWSRRAPYRRTVGNSDPRCELSLREWNEDNFPLVFGGGIVSSTTNGHQFVPPLTSTPAEYCAVLDMTDGTKLMRLVLAKFAVIEPTETQLMKTEASALPLACSLMIPDNAGAEWYTLVKHPGFTVA